MMKAFRLKDFQPLMALTVLLLFTGSLHAEVTDFPPQARQPYEKGPKKNRMSPPPGARAPSGIPAAVRKREDPPSGDRGAGPQAEPGPYVLGDKYWRAAYEYCRRHGGRIIDGGRLCVM